MLGALPLVFVFLLAQRQIVEGVAGTGREVAISYTISRDVARVHSRRVMTGRRSRLSLASGKSPSCRQWRPQQPSVSHGSWLWMHNGFIDGFATIKRDLVLAVDESLYPEIKGQTDTETLFYLALTFGLEDDPPDAVARAIGFVEACGRRRGIKYPFQGTIATTDGQGLWAFRYSSEGKSRSLFFSRDVGTLRQL